MALAYRATPTTASVAGGSSFSFTKPAGTAAGDWIIIGVMWAVGSTCSSTGFTATTVANSGQPFTLLTRLADGTEGSTITVNLSSGAYAGACMAVVSGASSSMDPASQATPNGDGGSYGTSIDVNSITLSNDGDWVLWFGGTDSGTQATAPAITPPTGFTTRATIGAVDTNPNCLIADNTADFTSPGSTGVQSGTSDAAEPWAGVMVGLTPANDTVTVSATNLTWYLETKVLVLTGVTESGGASVATNPSITNPQSSITPNYSGSYIAWEAIGSNSSYDISAAASNTLIDHDNSFDPHYADGYYSGTVTAGNAVTAGGVSSGIPGNEYCTFAAYEVPPNGTPALHSATAVASSDTSPVTTAAFYAPPGSVLVALVRLLPSSSSTISISDSLGLSWTLRASTPSPTSNGQLAVYTATVPGGSTDATVTPSTVAGTASIAAPAVTSNASITASPVSGAASIPVPQISTGAGVNATAVSGTATIPAPAFIYEDITWQGTGFGLWAPADATISSVSVSVTHHESATSDFDSLTGQILISGTPVGSAAAFTLSATDRTDVVTVTSGVTPADLANLQVRVTGHVLTAAGTLYIDLARADVTLSAPTQDANPQPGAVAGIATVPAPVIVIPAEFGATAVTGISSIQVPAVSETASIVAAAVNGTVIIAATISAGSTASASIVAGTSGIALPAFTASSILSLSVLNGIATIPVPAVAAGGSASVSPGVVAGVSSIPAPGAVAGSQVPASPVPGLASMPAPAASTGAGPLPADVAGAGTIPAPGIITSAGVSASVANTIASIPQPQITAGVSITLTAVSGTAAIPAPFVAQDAIWQGDGFGLSAPAGSDIISVTVTVQHHEASLAAVESVSGQILVSGTPVGSSAAFTKSLTDRTDDIVVTSGIAVADLPNVQVRVTSHMLSASAAEYIDWAQASVEFVPPTPANAYPVLVAGIASIPAAMVQTAGNANVSPPSVAGTVSVPAPVLHTGMTVSAPAAGGSASIPLPGVAVIASVSPSPVAGMLTVPVPAFSVDANPAASVINGTVSIGSVSIAAGGSAAVSPANVAGSAQLPAVTVQAASILNASAADGVASIGSVSILAGGSANINATAVAGIVQVAGVAIEAAAIPAATVADGTASMPVPSVSAGGGASASAVAGTASIAAVAGAGSQAAVPAVDGSAAIGTAQIFTTAGVPASFVSGIGSIPLPGIFAGGNVNIHPASVSANTAIPGPSGIIASALVPVGAVSGSASVANPAFSSGAGAAPANTAGAAAIAVPSIHSIATASGGPLSCAASIAVPAVSTGGDATPNAVAGIASASSPSIGTSTGPHSVAISCTASIAVPGITTTGNATPAVAAAAGSVPPPGPYVLVAAYPAAVAGAATVPVPAIQYGNVLSPSAVDGSAAVPGPSIYSVFSISISASLVAGSASLPLPDVGVLAFPDNATVNGYVSIPIVGPGTNSILKGTVIQFAGSVPAPEMFITVARSTAEVTHGTDSTPSVTDVPPASSPGVTQTDTSAPEVNDGTASEPSVTEEESSSNSVS